MIAEGVDEFWDGHVVFVRRRDVLRKILHQILFRVIIQHTGEAKERNAAQDYFLLYLAETALPDVLAKAGPLVRVLL